MVSEGDNSSISLETKDETNPMVSEGNNFNRSHDGTTPLVNEEVESSLLTIEDSTSDDGNKTTGNIDKLLCWNFILFIVY